MTRMVAGGAGGAGGRGGVRAWRDTTDVQQQVFNCSIWSGHLIPFRLSFYLAATLLL